ncbi:MAG: 3-deoxy-manno-octulosonate cytidylyltransferase [Bacteroidetes bacterium]|nr:3-deoxy-manno-octulosonate cytidylyltransferase [Bacteroidota bacterium]
MKIAGIIPARYSSSRFPGKPLANINGKTMIQLVYEQALKASSLEDVIVATDDQRIFDVVNGFGGKVMMTGLHHKSGTDRCMEVMRQMEPENMFDGVVNIQGDEPFVDPQQIDELAALLIHPQVQIATLAKRIDSSKELFDSNVNKVVLDYQGFAIYFSRHPIPFQQKVEPENWIQKIDYYKHIGLYAYRAEVLKQVTQLPVSSLETAEALEQLRWIENGYRIKVGITTIDSHSVDTPEDLSKFLNRP